MRYHVTVCVRSMCGQPSPNPLKGLFHSCADGSDPINCATHVSRAGDYDVILIPSLGPLTDTPD
jgi:hypothetical protein